MTRYSWQEFQRASSGNARLQETYGPVWMDMMLRLGEYLQARGTLGSVEEQLALSLPPGTNPCGALAREILVEATGAHSPEDLRHSIFAYLERRTVSQDALAKLLPMHIGDDASYDDVSRELWDMWNGHGSRGAGG